MDVDAAFAPLVTYANGTLLVYDGPVVANSQEYLIAVASVGWIGYAAAAFTLAYVLLSIPARLLWTLVCSSSDEEEADKPEDEDSGLSLEFTDKVKLASLALVLVSFAAAVVSCLYGLEVYELTERATNALLTTLEGHTSDLYQVLDNVNLKTAENVQRQSVLIEQALGVTREVVHSNQDVLDEAYVGANCLVFVVPAVVICFFAWSFLAIFQNHRGGVVVLGRVLPLVSVTTAIYFGMSIALPTLYTDVCTESETYIAKVEAHAGPGFAALNESSVMFGDSLYPCPQSKDVGLSSLVLTNELRRHANNMVGKINQDLQDLAEKSGAWYIYEGGNSISLKFLCLPYEETLVSEGDCPKGDGTGNAARHTYSSSVKELACTLHAEGHLSLPSRVYEERKCGYVEQKPSKPGFPFRYINVPDNFSKSMKDGGYAEYANVMQSQGGTAFESMTSQAASVASLCKKSDVPVGTSTCKYTVQALRSMTNYGERCDRLDLVADIFWVTNLVAFAAVCFIALCLEILRVKYADYDMQKIFYVEERGIPSYTASPPGTGSGYDVEDGQPHASAPSAPPLPMPMEGMSSGRPVPVMGYALEAYNSSSRLNVRRNTSYRLTPPPMKVF